LFPGYIAPVHNINASKSRHLHQCSLLRHETTTTLCGNALLLAAARLAIDGRRRLLVLVIVVNTLVLAGRDPKAALAVLERLVLAGEVDALARVAVRAALGQSTSASGEL